MRPKGLWSFLAMLVALSVAACSESNSQSAFSNVAVSFSTGSSQTAGGVSPAFARTAVAVDTLRDGTGNTLVLSTAEVVLREIELRRLEVVNCDVEPEPDGCEKFETGPVLIDLPLDGSTSREFSIQIDPGTYTEIEFEVHKVSGDDPEDQAFLQQHPTFDDISIRVAGSFNGTAFVFESDLNVDQELGLSPNLVIADNEQTSTNVTILVDVSRWFVNQSGVLVDPETANKGGDNENLVRDNIQDSFEAFEDEDEDGSR